jgi:hypothetical protein
MEQGGVWQEGEGAGTEAGSVELHPHAVKVVLACSLADPYVLRYTAATASL